MLLWHRLCIYIHNNRLYRKKCITCGCDRDQHRKEIVSFELIQLMEGVGLQQTFKAEEKELKKKYTWYPKGISSDVVKSMYCFCGNITIALVLLLGWTIYAMYTRGMCPLVWIKRRRMARESIYEPAAIIWHMPWCLSRHDWDGQEENDKVCGYEKEEVFWCWWGWNTTSLKGTQLMHNY